MDKTRKSNYNQWSHFGLIEEITRSSKKEPVNIVYDCLSDNTHDLIQKSFLNILLFQVMISSLQF